METIKLSDIGNSNAHYRFYTFETFLKHQKRLGVKRVDLFGATPHVWIDAYSQSGGKKTRQMIQSFGLTPGVFIPEFSSMRYTLGSGEESHAKTHEYLKYCLEFAAEMETSQMVITANGFLLDIEEKQRRFRLTKELGYVLDMAEPLGIRILLQNHYSDHTNMIRTIRDMDWCLKSMEGRKIGAALDVASAYEAGEDIEQWLLRFKDRLEYVCLSNTKFDGAKYYWGDGYLNLADLAAQLTHGAYSGGIGCFYMVRDYLKEPWTADERNVKMLAWAFEGREDERPKHGR